MRCAIRKSTPWAIAVAALVSIVFVSVLIGTMCATGAESQVNQKAPETSIATGSGKQFKTTVDRRTEGKLKPEDFRQASLLTSRVVLHMNKAARHIAEEENSLARKELENGQALVKVVRGLLPTTIVTTSVQDANGKEVYRYVDRVQEDRIPLLDGLVAVKILEPITDAKQDDATVQGLRLANADLLHTSVLVELGYVESKLNHALKLLDNDPKEALTQLAFAQSRGITYVVNKEDNPLVEAQMALQLAERMVEQGRKHAAKANLQLAKNHLELYRGLLAEGESEHVKKLQAEITKLQAEMGGKESAKTIRGFWDRVAGWFGREPGEMHTTHDSEVAKPEKAEKTGR